MMATRVRAALLGVVALFGGGGVVALGAAPASGVQSPMAPVKQIKMLAKNWQFIPERIEVVQGTRLQITIESKNAPHSFRLKEYGLDVKLPQDETTTVEFVADKAGEFKWRCGRPCGDGCPKMQGTLVVKPPTAQP